LTGLDVVIFISAAVEPSAASTAAKVESTSVTATAPTSL
jgi:hypothetical protein